MYNTSAKTIYLSDYKVPPYLIDTVNLEVTLDEESTLVTNKLVMKANPASVASQPDLTLKGELLELISISLDGKEISENSYNKTETALTIFNVPAAFTLEITTRIKPQENTALSGLYQSSGNFCTQCERKGFVASRIF